MKGAHAISTRRAYGVQRVCRVWHRARSSVYARRQATTSPCRRGPVGAAPDDVLVGHIGRMLEASPFHGEGYRKAWAQLRVEGIRTSQERVRRLMREHDLQAPHRVGHAHGPKAHDGTITTEAPDVMWGTDMTTTVTVSEGAAFVFVAVDHCTTECIGLHAAKRGTRFEALEPIRQGVRERFGEIGDGVARGLRLRHEVHGVGARRAISDWTPSLNRDTTGATGSVCRRARRSRGSGGTRALTYVFPPVRYPKARGDTTAGAMDAAAPVDAHDAPTRACKTARRAVSHSAHSPSSSC